MGSPAAIFKGWWAEKRRPTNPSLSSFDTQEVWGPLMDGLSSSAYTSANGWKKLDPMDQWGITVEHHTNYFLQFDNRTRSAIQTPKDPVVYLLLSFWGLPLWLSIFVSLQLVLLIRTVMSRFMRKVRADFLVLDMTTVAGIKLAMELGGDRLRLFKPPKTSGSRADKLVHPQNNSQKGNELSSLTSVAHGGDNNGGGDDNGGESAAEESRTGPSISFSEDSRSTSGDSRENRTTQANTTTTKRKKKKEVTLGAVVGDAFDEAWLQRLEDWLVETQHSPSIASAASGADQKLMRMAAVRLRILSDHCGLQFLLDQLVTNVRAPLNPSIPQAVYYHQAHSLAGEVRYVLINILLVAAPGLATMSLIGYDAYERRLQWGVNNNHTGSTLAKVVGFPLFGLCWLPAVLSFLAHFLHKTTYELSHTTDAAATHASFLRNMRRGRRYSTACAAGVNLWLVCCLVGSTMILLFAMMTVAMSLVYPTKLGPTTSAILGVLGQVTAGKRKIQNYYDELTQVVREGMEEVKAMVEQAKGLATQGTQMVESVDPAVAARLANLQVKVPMEEVRVLLAEFGISLPELLGVLLVTTFDLVLILAFLLFAYYYYTNGQSDVGSVLASVITLGTCLGASLGKDTGRKTKMQALAKEVMRRYHSQLTGASIAISTTGDAMAVFQKLEDRSAKKDH